MSEVGVRDFCDTAMTEALGLRFVEGTVGPHSAPSAVMEELWDVRVRMERVEELLLQSYRLKEKLKRSHAAAKAIYDDEFDTELHRLNNSIEARMGEFTAAKDKSAKINLKLIVQIRAVREMDELHQIATETYYYIRTIHSGLETLKRDLDSVIRVYQIESSIGGRR